MSIEYALKIVSSAPHETIVELVRGAEATDVESLPRGFAIELPGVRCAILAVDDVDAEITQESHGLLPTIAIVFRIEKSRRDEGLRTMRAALVRLLRAEQGDAILLANLEHPALRRRDGHGVLDGQFGPWPKEMLAALGPSWTIVANPPEQWS